jgi:hypothetical protein
MNPLVAILLGLAVLVIGTLGCFQIYGSASANATAQNVSQVVQLIFSNVGQRFASDPNNFTGFNTPVAIQAGLVPSTWISDGPTKEIVDPWGGIVAFSNTSIVNGVETTTGGIDNAWKLLFDYVPRSVCAELGTFYTPQTFAIQVNGLDIARNPAYTGGTTSYPWPPAQATVEAACDKPKKNTIAWVVLGQ